MSHAVLAFQQRVWLRPCLPVLYAVLGMFSQTFWRFLRHARPYWLLIAGAILFGVLKFTLALSLPSALKYVFDYVLLRTELSAQEKFTRLLWALGLLTVLFVGRSPIMYLRGYLGAVAGNRIIFDMRRELHRHIQRLGVAYHASQRTGATISRLINDLNASQGILDQGVINVAMDVLFMSGVVVFLIVWDWRLAMASLLALPVYGLVFHHINPRLRAVSSGVQQQMEEMSGEVTEKLSGVQVVMSFVREKTEELRFFRRHRRYYTKVVEGVRIKNMLQTFSEFLTAFGPIVVIGYGGYRVLQGTLQPGDLLLFHGFLGHLYLPARRLADCSAIIQEKLAAVERVFALFDRQPDIEDAPNARPLVAARGRLEFRDVQFAYKPGQPVLKGISLEIEPGQAVAIVGRSGAGKSTLVNLIPRFYDVTGGAVLIDGHDVRELTLRSLREHIGIVLQDTILFSGSIRDNILYGRHNATEEEMIEAAKRAHVHEFVQELPRGYDTLIGERGVSLSGGQKQRVSIARAFLRDPRILILDEATSNLDSGSEIIIRDALRELMQGRTTLVIAHRLSTVINCDFVVVLQEGRIVQQGRHEELISIKGPYRRFCKEQFGAVQLEALGRKAV